MFDRIEAFPKPDDNFAKHIPLTPAERKRAERAARRAAGLPDPRVVDAAVATAMAEALHAADFVGHCVRRGSVAGMTVDVEDVMRRAIAHVRAAKVQDGQVSRAAAHQAVAQRLRLV
ncbi:MULTISPECIES: hypothetical protein [Methylobacterium]|mgnify:CR=1 FL=1|uniref:hypothetical protein n=1 Tax=Methylobacterium TaxID=407 RepID=UPI0003F7F421|nr:hypothetical protein [Methylobacterium brachiatum]SFI11099.1 hypothetical protein SAMN02799642_00843 [Methylobacterium brachiatum]